MSGRSKVTRTDPTEPAWTHPHWCEQSPACARPAELDYASHTSTVSKWHVDRTQDDVEIEIATIRTDDVIDGEQVTRPPLVRLITRMLAHDNLDTSVDLLAEDLHLFELFLRRHGALLEDGAR